MAGRGAESKAAGAIIALALLPPLFLLAIFAFFSVDMPYLDQWEFVPFLQKAYGGTLSWQDFWAQHNEHRLVFPRLIMLALARISHWNIHYELAVNFLLGVLIFIIAAAQAGLTARLGRLSGTRKIVPCLSLALFSLSQWQNWFLGWQLQEFLNLFAVLAAILLLAQPGFRWRYFLGAIFLGGVATFSFANGILLWPVGVVMLFLNRPARPNRRWQRAFLWLAAAVMAISAYLYGYRSPAYHPPWTAVAAHPLAYPKYVLIYLGQPAVNWSLAGACAAGLLAVVLWVGLLSWLLLRRRVTAELLAPYIAFGLYALGSAAITGLARVGFGVEQALSSRYITMANPLWLAILVLAWLAFSAHEDTTKHRGVLRAAALVWVMLFSAASLYGAYRWTERCHAYRAARQEMLTGDNLELLRRFHPEPSVILERRPILYELGISIFREDAPQPPKR